jgi:hypothetical protein
MVSYTGSGNNDVAMIYDSGNLAVGNHTLKVRAQGHGISVDRAEISATNEIIVDNTSAVYAGTWATVKSPSRPGFFGTDYRTDDNAGKGSKTARFTPTIPVTGNYEVYGRWVGDPNKASNAPYTITYAGGTANLSVDQRTDAGTWTLIGTYAFNAGTTGNVLISNTGTTGTVVADAIRLVAVTGTPPPLPTVAVSAFQPAASETGTVAGVFHVTRDTTVGSLTVNFTLSGSAVSPSDYSATPSSTSVTIPNGQNTAAVTIAPVDDPTVETTETVQITLGTSSNYILGTDTATVTIADNDQPNPVVDVIATDADAAEAGSATGVFTVSRGTTAGGNLTVYYTIGGTATNGTDYVVTPTYGSVVIPTGLPSAMVTITPQEDALDEGNELAQLSITANGAYTIGTGSATVTIADNDQSPEWTEQDIGSPSIAGDTDYDDQTGLFTMKGSGLGMSGTSDSFHYAYQTLTGDGQLIARVSSITSTNSWARGGVMIRETLNPDSRYAFAYITKSANSGGFMRRTTTAGTPSATNFTGGPAIYLKVVRVGNTFTGYRSADGITWSTIASQTITMSTTVYVGLAVSSCLNSNLATVLIDNVQ